MPELVVLRRCNVCKTEKSLEEFPPIKIFKFGRSYTCRPCHTARCRDWQKRNKEKVKGFVKAHRQRFPERQRARKILNWHVSAGNIIKPTTCEQCGASGRIEAHHHKGYLRKFALDVQWLCTVCHGKTKQSGAS